MELLYHVTPDDSVIGSVDRNLAHAEGLLHRSGVVFVVDSKGRVLLQHRSPSKKIFPNCFESSCAFHVAYGENYEAAASRELKEETGVSAQLTFVGKFSHQDPPENQIVAVFRCNSSLRITIDPSEATNAQFYDKTEVDNIVNSKTVTPWLRDGWKLVRDKI